MTDKSAEYCLLALQIEHEETLSRLYKHYSELFPDIDLWKHLEEEEKNHAQLIHPIIRKVSDETIFFKGELESCEMIKDSLEILNLEIDKAKNKEIDLEYALMTAIEIEENMVELNFFRSMDTDAPFVEDLLRHIIMETEKHRFSLIRTKNKFIEEYTNIILPKVKGAYLGGRKFSKDILDKEINLDRELSSTDE